MDKRNKLKRVLGVIVLSFALLGMILFVPNSSSYAYALQDEEDFVLETSSVDGAFVWGEKVFAPYVQLSSGNKIM